MNANTLKMQKLLSLQLGSNIPRKLSQHFFFNIHPLSSLQSTNPSSLLPPKQPQTTFSPPPPPPPPPPCTQLPPPHFFSHFTCPYSWLLQNSVSKKVNGVLSNPLLVKQLVSTTHLGSWGEPHRFQSVVSQRREMDKVEQLQSSQQESWTQSQEEESRNNKQEERAQSQEGEEQWTSRFQGPDFVGIVIGLIIANVVVFISWRIADHTFMMKNFTISLDNFESGRVHTMITSAFSHNQNRHITSNMFQLFTYGMNIGRVFGAEFLLKLYLAGAVSGSLFYLVHHGVMAPSSKGHGLGNRDCSRTPSLGATGALTAIMLLDIFLFPKSTIYKGAYITVPAILGVIVVIVNDVIWIMRGDSQISGAAHLGGAVVAAMTWARIRKGPF